MAVSVMTGALVVAEDEDEMEEKQVAAMLVGMWVETNPPRPCEAVVVVVVVVVVVMFEAVVALRCW